MDRNNPESIALWSRWQWQSIDADPTTLFLNYTRRLNMESTAGAGFLQHNTGTFLLTGAALNYAYALELESNAQIAFGLNLFAYSRKLADDRFQPNPDIGLPTLSEKSNFLLQLAPSLRFKLDRFSVGIVAENLFDYNFSTKEKDTAPTKKTYIGLASYQIPLSLFGSQGAAFLQPTIYLKTMPGFDNQIGINSLLSTPKFWAQAGYNNFYGISGGAGGRFFKRLSLGVLMEFGTDATLEGLDPSFEIITAYRFGAMDASKEVDDVEEEDVADELKKAEEIKAEEAERNEEARKLDALAGNRQKATDSVAAVKAQQRLETEKALTQQRKLDSIASVRKEAALAEAAAQKQKNAREEAVKPQAGEKYEETRNEDGLQTGYYLIVNVFGTKKYFDGFMKTLKSRGLQPKSFYRSVNKYNYVYLERYDTLTEARKARDSKFNGKYPDNTWIFRVVGN